ncbi:hypothetical protein JXA80_00725 [bacterium]|nr:hypothetical protein [candidate division CSSED10-310 bacterium]
MPSNHVKQYVWPWIRLCLFCVLGLLPVLFIPLYGVLVPTAAQPNYSSPGPSLTRDSEWVQTFLFPDRPVSAVALRLGTFRRRAKGQVVGSVGPAPLVIDLSSIRDNRWKTFCFEPFQQPPGTPCILRLRGERLPETTQITFWRNMHERFPDGGLTIDGVPQPGDLTFKILCRVRGLDVLRMLKTRWQAERPPPWNHPSLPVILAGCWAIVFGGMVRRWFGGRS